jgi:nucleoside-diphosphate-sugar epimerase
MNRSQFNAETLIPLLDRLDFNLFQNSRFFITGGTGFFGFWLLSALELLHASGTNLEVVILSRNPSLFLKNNSRWRNLQWLKFQRGDVKSFSFSKSNFDYLIHAATDTSQAAQSDPLSFFQDIVDGSKRVLEFAVNSGIRRALFTSSGAVYGDQHQYAETTPESALITRPSNLAAGVYGEGKRVMEMLASVYYQKHGIESVIARCFAFVGPNLPLNRHFAIGNFIHDALYSDSIIIKGDGSSVRSYLYGADLAVWLLKLLVSGQPGKAYNVGSDRPINMLELAKQVSEVIFPGKTIVVQSVNRPNNNHRSYYVPNIDFARNNNQLDVWTDLTSAIQLTAKYQFLK